MSNGTPDPLARIDRAAKMLAEARSLDEIRSVRDEAEACRAYAKSRGLSLEAINHAAAIKVRAERRLGELLPETVSTGRPEKGSRGVTLSDLDLTKMQSSRFQKLATVADDDFEASMALAEIRNPTLSAALGDRPENASPATPPVSVTARPPLTPGFRGASV